MNRTIVLGLSASLVLAVFSTSTVADDADHMLSIGALQVKGGHESALVEGIAEWKDCYHENDGQAHWNVWRRMHGDGTVFVATFFMDRWADLDQEDPAYKACNKIGHEKITANVHGSSRSFAKFMPDWSMEPTSAEVVNVLEFHVSDNQKFRTNAEKIVESMRNVEGQPRGYWYQMFGGASDDADYLVVVPFDSFSELDEDRPGVRAILAEHRGDEAAEQIMSDLMESVDALDQFLYRRMADLSHPPAD